MPYGFKDQPCKQDCPGRSAECKCSCEKWAEFEARKQEDYERRRKQGQHTYDLNSLEIQRYKKGKRHG